MDYVWRSIVEPVWRDRPAFRTISLHVRAMGTVWASGSKKYFIWPTCEGLRYMETRPLVS